MSAPGARPFRLGVLVSGSGTNLQAILDAIAAAELGAEVALVVSNVKGARALARAEARGVPTTVLEHRAFASREAFDEAVVGALRAHDVECVVLAGFMRLVTRVLLEAFPDRVVNVHPALLPAFPGVDAPRQALAYGSKITGCTVHLVDEGMDTGPILAQASVPVLETDTVDSLAARIREREHRLLPEVLGWFAAGCVKVTRETESSRPRVAIVGARSEA